MKRSVNKKTLEVDHLATIRAIRGEFSQSQVMSKLGVEHNIIAKWENGHTRIRWGQFIDRSCREFSVLSQANTKKTGPNVAAFLPPFQADYEVFPCSHVLGHRPDTSASHIQV